MDNLANKAIVISRQYMVRNIFMDYIIKPLTFTCFHLTVPNSNYVTWLLLQQQSQLLHLELKSSQSTDGIPMLQEINHIYKLMKLI